MDGELFDMYENFLDVSASVPQFRRFVHLVLDSQTWPLGFGCKAGKDRTVASRRF